MAQALKAALSDEVAVLGTGLGRSEATIAHDAPLAGATGVVLPHRLAHRRYDLPAESEPTVVPTNSTVRYPAGSGADRWFY